MTSARSSSGRTGCPGARLTDQPYAKQQIIKFLEQLQPHDRVALYAMGPGPMILQKFTSSSRLLLRALTDY